MIGARPARAGLLVVLPLAYVAVETVLRSAAGPFWMWHTADPSYFYLLDALNLIELATPGHVTHPGTPVQWLGALAIRFAHPLLSASALAEAVLTDPERFLRLISALLVALSAAAQLAAGWVAWRVLGAIVPALLVQSGPFLSMLTLKHGYHAKPEGLLVFAVMMLAAVTLAALEPAARQGDRRGLAVAFGAVAGFTIATKITAAPLFLLPVFLLSGAAALGVYALSALGFLLLFMLPAAGAWGFFLDWNTRIFMSSGVFMEGEHSIIDVARYPAEVVRMFSRPVLHLPVIAGLVLLALARIRRRRGLTAPRTAETAALGGYCLAVVAQVLLVAKQPSGHYLIPAFVLAGLGFALVHRVAAGFGWGQASSRRLARRTVGALLAAGLAVQGLAAVRLERELVDRRAAALAVDDGAFKACARVFYYAASSPVYALMLGDYVTGSRFAARLAQRHPSGDYWLADWFGDRENRLRDWDSVVGPGETLTARPCLFVRGGRYRASINAFLSREAPGLNPDADCSTADERMFTIGVDCRGHPLGGGAPRGTP